MKRNNDFSISSGNVFLDIEVSNPEEMFAKAELAHQISNLIKQKNITQAAAAELLEIDQPKISALSKGKFAGFSLERLFRFLNILGQTVTIKIAPKAQVKRKPDVSVSFPKTKNEPSLTRPRSLQARKKTSK